MHGRTDRGEKVNAKPCRDRPRSPASGATSITAKPAAAAALAVAVAATVAVASLSGCKGNSGSPGDGGVGTEGMACYGNQTCNAGLVCLSRLCVKLADGGLGDGRRSGDAWFDGFGSDASAGEATLRDAGTSDGGGRRDTGRRDAKSDARTCGNAIIDPGEQCDGVQLGGATCTSLGFTRGKLSCTSACKFDLSDCARCGDGVISGGESCDGTQIGNYTCISQGYWGGLLTCKPDCTLDYTSCTPILGFSGPCTADGALKCGTGLTCVFSQPGATRGYCTRTCTNSGQQCPGGPAGTFAGCILQIQTQGGGTQNVCGFICEHPQAGKYSCPGELVCATQDDPKGSGQKPCKVP